MDESWISPVERRGSYLFKREDLYAPYDFSPANGSKLRQCQLLIKSNIDKAKNGIITGTSVLSPQCVIVSSVARELGVSSTVLFGGTTMDKLMEKKYPAICKELGSIIMIPTKMAYTSVLNSHANKMADELGLYNVRYGFDLISNLDVFVGSVARQVSNIPDEIDNLIVTVGSGITLIGILYGIAICDKNVRNVIAVGCAPNRVQKINEYANLIYIYTGTTLPLDKLRYVDAFNTMKGFKYENTATQVYEGLIFHPRYEAKTFSWVKSQEFQGDTLFWVTGTDMN